MHNLFPEIEPFRSEYLAVGDGHELYLEQCGRQGGVPIVVVHGGPGSGCTPTMRRFFDPDYYRIILFDQRGANRSRPMAEVKNNSPDLLVADMEKIRAHLNIDQWHVFGGSWGSTLSLLYAQAHPEKCLSLTLRGIFLMQRYEIDWMFQQMKHVFPEHYERFINFLPETERAEPLENYYRRLTSDDPAIHGPAADAWNLYETSSAMLIPDASHSAVQDDAAGLGRARIECHYFLHELFAPDDRILRDVGALRGIPASIIQGRYDMICPVITAYALHRAWPEAEFIIVPDSGHSANDPAMRSALVAATERLKTSGI